MSNTAIYHIYVALNIKFNSDKVLRKTKTAKILVSNESGPNYDVKIVFLENYLQNMLNTIQEIQQSRNFMKGLMTNFFPQLPNFCLPRRDSALGYACLRSVLGFVLKLHIS